jgi:hypothetical protein
MDKISINIWINEQRYQEICQAGLEDMAEEVLAGMKVLHIFCTEDQKERILKQYTQAKYDQSTTKSIELLPVEFKDQIFKKVIEKKSLDVIQEVL